MACAQTGDLSGVDRDGAVLTSVINPQDTAHDAVWMKVFHGPHYASNGAEGPASCCAAEPADD